MEQNVSQSNKAVTEQIQNNPFNHINFNPKDVNYALIVTEVLAKYGMQPIEKSITNLADYQQSNSANQNALTSGQSMTSNMMGNSNSTTGLPANYWTNNGQPTTNTQSLKQWAEQYEKMYGSDPTAPTLAQMEQQIESQLEGYGVSPANAKAMMNTFMAQAESGPYKSILTPGSGNLSGVQYNMLEKLKTEIDSNRAGLSSGQITAGNFVSKVYNPSNDMAMTNAFAYYGYMNQPITGTTGTVASLFQAWQEHGYATTGPMFTNLTWGMNEMAEVYAKAQSSSSTDTPLLSELGSGAQTAATGYQQMSNDAVTDLQSDVSIMGSDDNIGQAIIKYAVQNEQTAVGNFKT